MASGTLIPNFMFKSAADTYSWISPNGTTGPNINFAAGETTLYGGTATGDNLLLQSNSTDSDGYITIKPDDNMLINAPSTKGVIIVGGATLCVGDSEFTPEDNENLQIKTTVGNFTVQRSSSDTNSPRLRFFKTRGTVASPTAVQSGDILGNFTGGGYDGSNNQLTWVIRGEAAENFSVGNEGTKIEFRTTSTGAAASTSRWFMQAGGDWDPAADNSYDIGDATHRAKEIFCVTLTQGDVKYTEKKCAICEQAFTVGQKLSLIVISAEEDGTRCVPCHQDCEYTGGEIYRDADSTEVKTEPVDIEVDRDGEFSTERTFKVKDIYVQAKEGS